MSPRVAVCIPTYNQADYIGDAIKSALNQVGVDPPEVWVSDDASTDHTAQVLAEFLEDDRVNIMLNETNRGISANSSSVLRQPSTEFVVRLDSDDRLDPRFLAHLLPLMEEHPRAGYGHTAVRQIDEHGNIERDRLLARSTGYQEADAALRAAIKGYRTAANILVFRKQALDEVDYYEGRPDFGEDWDLSIRLADSGWGNVYVNKTLADYRVWTDATGVRARRTALQFQGYQRVFNEAIEPAWARRGWDPQEAADQRAALAKHRIAWCYSPTISGVERRELLELLLSLSSAPAVRRQIWLCDHGAAGVLARWESFKSLPRRAVKRAVRPLRQ